MCFQSEGETEENKEEGKVKEEEDSKEKPADAEKDQAGEKNGTQFPRPVFSGLPLLYLIFI